MSDEKDIFSDISEKISSGQHIGAKRALTNSWRDAVPDLPVRFAVILVRLDRDNTRTILKRMRKSKTKPNLRLVWEDDHIEVWTSRGTPIRIGDLPVSDSIMMNDLGDKAKKYKPQLLEINTSDETGEIEYLAIELVRPDTKSEKEASSKADMISAIEAIAENLPDSIDLGFDKD